MRERGAASAFSIVLKLCFQAGWPGTNYDAPHCQPRTGNQLARRYPVILDDRLDVEIAPPLPPHLVPALGPGTNFHKKQTLIQTLLRLNQTQESFELTFLCVPNVKPAAVWHIGKLCRLSAIHRLPTGRPQKGQQELL